MTVYHDVSSRFTTLEHNKAYRLLQTRNFRKNIVPLSPMVRSKIAIFALSHMPDFSLASRNCSNYFLKRAHCSGRLPVVIDRHALGHQRGYTIRVPTRYSNTMHVSPLDDGKERFPGIHLYPIL